MRRLVRLARVVHTLGTVRSRGATLLVAGLVVVASCAGGQAVNGGKAQDVFPDARVRGLAEAAARGDAAEVASLVKGGVDPNGTGRDGIRPLVWAMQARSQAGMRALLAAGADPNVVEPPDFAPLLLAAASDDATLLRTLLDGRGNPNVRDRTGSTPLKEAIMHGQWANMRLLVERGADVNATDKSHSTPAMLAASTGAWEQVAWLLEHGADPTIPRLTGGTLAYALERAGPPRDADVRRGYDRTRQLLVTRGVRFPAEPPEQVRRRVFGADNPIDAGRPPAP
jgi:hypothetical protein